MISSKKQMTSFISFQCIFLFYHKALHLSCILADAVLLVWGVTIQLNEQEVIMQHTLPWSQTHHKMMWRLQKTMFTNKEKIQIFAQKHSDFQQHYRKYKLDTRTTVSLNSMVTVRWGSCVSCLMFTKWSQNRTPSHVTRMTSAPVLS